MPAIIEGKDKISRHVLSRLLISKLYVVIKTNSYSLYDG